MRPSVSARPSRMAVGRETSRIVLLPILTLFFSAGTARSQESFGELGTGLSLSEPGVHVEMLDVEGDGDLDLVLGAASTHLLLNDGRAGFTAAPAGSLPAAGGRDVAAGDVDADGDPDLVIAGTTDILLLNDGSGVFSDVTASRMPAGSFDSLAVAMGDVDGDGDPDLVFASGQHTFAFGCTFFRGVQNRLYLNDGAGSFRDATSRLPQEAMDSTDVVLGDVDADGDLDIVFANIGDDGAPAPNSLYLNDGSGVFTDATATRMPGLAEQTMAAALGDVDGDGDLDAVFGSYRENGGLAYPPRVYTNDGSGSFSNAPGGVPGGPYYDTHDLALGDIDGDGDLDVVLARGDEGRECGQSSWTTHPSQNALFLNDGTGTFVDATSRMPADREVTYALALGDLDGDGDLDLAVAGNEQGSAFGGGTPQNHRYVNLLRHLEAPEQVAIGSTFDLVAYSRRFGAPTLDTAFAFAAAGPATIPLPLLGTFGLDPAALLPLPQIPVPQPFGSFALPLSMPAAPSLIGASLWWQAAIADALGGVRLTNVAVTRITS